jgi:hypothetical protein
MSREYWALAPIDKIAHEVTAKFDDYKTWLRTSGYGFKIRAAYETYYGVNKQGTLQIERDDDLVDRISVNHYRSLIKRLQIMVTENKLAYQPRAKNSDSKSLIEADLARGIVEYYGDEKHMNEIFSNAVLQSLIMMETYIHTPWDKAEGYELSVDNERVVKTGDQAFQLFSPFDCARNTTDDRSNWYIIREKVNKFDLAELYPEFADEIKNESITRDFWDLNIVRPNYQFNNLRMIDDPDYCYKYHLYHARTPALEQGRHTIICANQVLSDGPLVYDKVPVFRLKAGTVLETCLADSPAIDLLPLQQGLDALFSALTTNAVNNARQMIYCPDPNLATIKLDNGQTLVTASAPPVGLNLSANAADSYKLVDMYMQHQQLISGVNDSSRGNPQASLKSGNSIALMLAQAIQYVNEIQKAYAQVASDVATCLINNIQRFANEEMIAYITGTNRKGSIKKFTAQDVMNIERVTVDLGSPITQTLAGRHELVQQFLQYQIIKDPKQIVAFLRTGELDQTTDSLFSDAMLIKEENELIKKGEKPICLILDNHQEHILEHKTIFSSPEARRDPMIAEVGLAHIQEHIEFMRSMPPDLAAVITGQPLPPEAPPPPAGGELPEVQGVNVPGLPPGTPPTVEENYNQALAGIPPQQEPMI